MSEQHMRRVVVDSLREAGRDPISVENPAYPGTPDVNFVEGWVELKQLPEWPKKEATPVAVPHFTPQQRIWLLKRARAGGNIWLLLQVEKEWLLLDGATASEYLGRVPKSELIFRSTLYMKAGLDRQALTDKISLGKTRQPNQTKNA